MRAKTIFNNASYNAASLSENDPNRATRLIVSSSRRQFGKILEGKHAKEWAEAIRTALDKHEAHALCKAVIEL